MNVITYDLIYDEKCPFNINKYYNYLIKILHINDNNSRMLYLSIRAQIQTYIYNSYCNNM